MTPLYHPRPTRWPQVSLRRFSLRTLFVLIAVVGITARVGPQLKWIWGRHQALNWLAAGNGSVVGSVTPVDAPSPIGLFGEKGVWGISLIKPHGGAFNPEDLARLFPEARIDVTEIVVSRRGPVANTYNVHKPATP